LARRKAGAARRAKGHDEKRASMIFDGGP
jgi:hypothetical protein